ncbi:MAG TPA: phage tail sheath C-terminal domain-containing protein, partial [Ferruginibacter sp.]|nr:phage tail sheath C-terminal domain-containing protein [Ferruginibacter sp.]
RTLDGNSMDWRYVSVRRTITFIEQSIQKGAGWVVFEPNDAHTWAALKAMIENFLLGLWRQGALAGAKPEEAFTVHIGLGTSMTAVDILEGILRVFVNVAVSRPAEFIVIAFQFQTRKS